MKTDGDMNVGLVVMASGLGKRFGGNKLMETLDNKPLIKWVLDSTEGLFEKRVVVTRNTDVKSLCDELNIDCIIHNFPNRNDTIRLGLEKIKNDIDYCFFVQGDQPLISKKSIDSLIFEAKKHRDMIIRAGYGDIAGSPVGFPRNFFDELLNLPIGKGGSYVVKNNAHMTYTVNVENEYELWDVDTVSDLEKIRVRCEMIKAYLTIDDITSNNTKAIIDYLCEKDIQVVLFAWGKMVENNREAAIYALKKGMIIGNHSYSHPFFSELSVEEGIAEIEKCDEIINKLYKEAGVERKYKLFRFPYGDKGGANKEVYQQYFKEHGYDKLDDRDITIPYWAENNLDKDIDTFWTFDLEEYRIRVGSDFTEKDVMKRIDGFFDEINNGSIDKNSKHFILIHAHDETEELVPEYYKTFIDELINRGVKFENPQFF